MSAARDRVDYLFCPDLSASTWARVILPFRAVIAQSHEGHDLRLAAGMEPQYATAGDAFVFAKLGHRNVFDYVMELHNAGKRVVFDLDYFPELPPYHELARPVIAMRPYLELVLSNADVVTTPSGRLARELAAYSADVRVVPDCIDTGIWLPDAPSARREDVPDDAIVVAWTAPPGSDPDLEPVAHALAALARDDKRVRVLNFGSERMPIPETQQVRIEFDRYTRYPAMLDGVDIAIVPKLTTLFNDCASARQALEFGARGIPVVASPTVPHRALEEQGAPLTLADSPDAWAEALGSLAQDADRRAQQGAALRAWVERERSLADHAPDFLALLSEDER